MLKAGLNLDIANDDYHADREYISSSGLKLMLKDPRSYYKQYILGEKESFSSTAMDMGSYIHSLILEPHLTEAEFAIYPGATRRGSVWEDFKALNSHKTIITKSQADKADAMIKEYNEGSIILGKHGYENEVPYSSFFTDGFAEQTFCGNINGVKIKVRFDYRKECEKFASINDVKTTGDYCDKPSDAERICRTWDYALSAALYCDVAEQVTGRKHDFYFLFMSKKDHKVALYRASEEMLERGRAEYLEAIEKLKIARETGIYFENKIQELK